MSQRKGIEKQRAALYGDPQESHKAIARAWSAFLLARHGVDVQLTDQDVALMMVMFKVCRTARSAKAGISHADNYVDGHAYLQFAERFDDNPTPKEDK